MLPWAIRWVFLAPACLLAVAAARGDGPYRMEGTVIDADANSPIAGAEVQVLIQSEQDPSRRVLKGVTDEQGQYSIELPIGHAWAWTVVPPAGYCRPPEPTGSTTFATTKEHPVHRQDYQLQKGVSVEIEAELPEDTALTGRLLAAVLSQQSEGKFVVGYAQLNQQGRGVITLAELAGKFDIACGDESRTLLGPEGATVEFEKGFDPRTVTSDLQRDESGLLTATDEAGRTARLSGCEARVRDRQLTIVVPVKSALANGDSATVTGQVVHSDAVGVPGATVGIVFHSGGGSAAGGIETVTDKDGRFSLDVPQISKAERISLTVTCDGYAGFDTEPIKLAKPAERRIDAGKITLPAESSIRIQAVGPTGDPLVGALIEPVSGYAARKRITRTGPEGDCLLTGLAPGLVSIQAHFGALAAHARVPLEPGENEPTVIRLRPIPSADSPKPMPLPPPLAVGAAAPELTVVEWTDGKQRTLADYRGKVVVLDFWGTWCGPCIQMIPTMKALHKQYQDREVVFLGIHTAGTEMPLVKRLLKNEEWDLTVGLDVGEDVASGSTIRSYAIHGFPTVMIVGRDGRVAFSTDIPEEQRADFMRNFQKLAKEAGVPWPLDKDATQEETLQRMVTVHKLMLSQAIDKALAEQAE